MSFFMYNQDCSQAIARPYLDLGPITGTPGFSPLDDYSYMPKYHQQDNWDAGTNAPSSNFVYDFEEYHWLVRDSWREVFSHSADGTVVSGSLAALTEMFNSGCEIKVGIKGLCSDLTDNPADAIEHEVFVDLGSCYYYTKRKLFIAASHPLVRVKPEIPVRYASKNWDFGWLVLRTDGFIARRLCNPYTLKFSDSEGHYAVRWFVR